MTADTITASSISTQKLCQHEWIKAGDKEASPWLCLQCGATSDSDPRAQKCAISGCPHERWESGNYCIFHEKPADRAREALTSKQKVRGVGRDGIDERCLWVHFDFPVTDDDMRAFHDFARGFPGRRFDDPLIASLREAAMHAKETYGSNSIAKTIHDAISALMQSSAETKATRAWKCIGCGNIYAIEREMCPVCRRGSADAVQLPEKTSAKEGDDGKGAEIS